MVFSLNKNTKRFTEITSCNLSQRLVELTLLFFFNDLEEHEFPSDCTLKDGIDFSLQSPEFYRCIQFEIRKRLAAKLWSRESDSVYNHLSQGATNQ